MDLTVQRERAETFRRLHQTDAPLILFNAWDVASAQAIAASSPAIATSSWAVGTALGYGDGENVPLPVVTAFVERLTAAVTVPVSVDFEAGYGDSPEAAAASVTAIVKAGAVGVNLEDSLTAGKRALVDPALHAAKIRAVRAATNALGVPLFINARADTFYMHPGSPEERLQDALQRAAVYTDAGADGIFVPNLLDIALIERLVKAVTLPVNIMAAPNGPGLPELRAAGVRRVSLGGWTLLAAMRSVGAAAAAVASSGTFDALTAAQSVG